MLTGQNPFYRDSVPSVVMAILHEPPRTLEGVPDQLQEIVYRALSKDPQQRYQNCAEILSDLERVKPEFALPAANMDASARTRSDQVRRIQEIRSGSVEIRLVSCGSSKVGAIAVGG